MILPRWLRRTIASWKALRSPEYGGMLINWNNGKFDFICMWNTDEGLEESWKLVENFYNSGRDEIYIAVVKQGYRNGYLVIHSPERILHIPIAFWHGYFSIEEAFLLMRDRCRELGTKMGYRDPGQ